MKIDCISDLHGHYPQLDGGDLLIIAGDLTDSDEPSQHLDFIEWIKNQQYKKKIVIAGNHDNFIQKLKSPYFHHIQSYVHSMEYLCDSGTEFQGLKIWGSPWTKTFKGMNPHCKAFTLDTEEELAEKFSLIPYDTDILVTHSPAYGIFDENIKGKLCGSTSLLIKLAEIKPFLHCFGHIHEKGGKDQWIPWRKGTTVVNASQVNQNYEPVNKPIRVIL